MWRYYNYAASNIKGTCAAVLMLVPPFSLMTL